MSVKELLGKKIKKIRKQRGLTQEALAEMIDISPRNMSRIEVGDIFVTADTLEKILSALNVTADILFSYNTLRDNKETLADIYAYLDKIKYNSEQLGKAYKLIKLVAEGEI